MIKYEDLRTGDIVTMERDAFEVRGPVYVDDHGTPYFETNDGYMIIESYEFVSAERPKKLPTEAGSVIYDVVTQDVYETYAVLGRDGFWYTSSGAIVGSSHITKWEERE